MRIALMCALLFLGGATHATEYDPKLYFNGTLDLATALSDDGLPVVNTFRRGDTPYDNLRLTLYADAVVHPRLTVFNQVLLDPSSRASVASFLRSYVRFTVRPDADGDLHLEAGKLPMTFGSYPDRAHSNRYPLIMPPLMYHYFSSLRAGQIPADNADLLAHRGQGSSGLFTGFRGVGIGGFNGLPMIYETCWDTGIRAIGSLWRFEYGAVVAQGTLSDPKSGGGDNNSGKSFGGKLAFVANRAMLFGVSFARGPYLDEGVADTLRASGQDYLDYNQDVVGFDASFAVGHLQIIGEYVYNRWASPNIVDGAGRRQGLSNMAFYVEAKYAFGPGAYLVGRYDRMWFGEIDDGSGTSVAWDDDIRRAEGGIGYYLTDGVIGKVMLQYTDKDGPNGFTKTFGAAQLSISF